MSNPLNPDQFAGMGPGAAAALGMPVPGAVPLDNLTDEQRLQRSLANSSPVTGMRMGIVMAEHPILGQVPAIALPFETMDGIVSPVPLILPPATAKTHGEVFEFFENAVGGIAEVFNKVLTIAAENAAAGGEVDLEDHVDDDDHAARSKCDRCGTKIFGDRIPIGFCTPCQTVIEGELAATDMGDIEDDDVPCKHNRIICADPECEDDRAADGPFSLDA